MNFFPNPAYQSNSKSSSNLNENLAKAKTDQAPPTNKGVCGGQVTTPEFPTANLWFGWIPRKKVISI